MKTMTVYKDTTTGEFYTKYDLESIYDSRFSETNEDYDDFEDFLSWQLMEGNIEELTAKLSDGRTVYPYYYVEEIDEFYSIMRMFAEFHDSDIPLNYHFSDFLNNPSVDRNGIQFYGFEG